MLDQTSTIRVALEDVPASADDAANHGDDEKESRREKCCMDRGLDSVPRGDRLLRRYGSVLVHVSMRNTQICHVSPPPVYFAAELPARIYILIFPIR